MKTAVVGVDPGKTGAIEIVGGEFEAKGFWKMPLIKGKGRNEYDLPKIFDLVRLFAPATAAFFIEKSQPMPSAMGGSIANFHRGVARGWEWMLTALELPYYLVAPKTWQKVMLADIEGKDTKQRSLLAAKRIFPTLKIGKHHGSADALLIAEYGRRQLKL
jgi:hypothetical protein